MHILQIASLVEPITAKAPGGAELSVQLLAAQLVARGHEVSLIAVSGSVAPPGVRLIDLGIKPGDLQPVATGAELVTAQPTAGSVTAAKSVTDESLAIREPVFEKVADFLKSTVAPLLVHNHGYDFDPLVVLPKLFPTLPFLSTLHLPPISRDIVNALATISTGEADAHYVVVSNAMQRLYRDNAGKNFAAIANGLRFSDIPCPNTTRDFKSAPYLFVGRISPEKGLHTAIDLVVDRLAQPLVIVGRIYDRTYFSECIEPRLANPLITYRGFLPREAVFSEMAGSRALVAPIEWDEPFGFVYLEALANGCPVVTFNRGAASEIITHGVSGYLAGNATTNKNETESEFCHYLQSVDKLNRRRCRESVLSKYDIQTMCAAYEARYSQLVSSD